MVNDFNRQDAKCAKEEVKRLLRVAWGGGKREA